jgi:hypothetical protein
MIDQWKIVSKLYADIMYNKHKNNSHQYSDQELLVEFEVAALLELLEAEE